MKFDRFLNLIFGKLGIIILAVALLLIPVMTTACSLEDALCLTFCGCLSPSTCRELILDCSTPDASCGSSSGSADESGSSCTDISCYEGCGAYSCTVDCVSDSCSNDPKYQCYECNELFRTPKQDERGIDICPYCSSRLVGALDTE